jgi:hypothetical protein
MDPDTALNDLITSVMNGELSEAQDRLEDLRAWRNQGGFAPKDPRTGTAQQSGAGWPARR